MLHGVEEHGGAGGRLRDGPGAGDELSELQDLRAAAGPGGDAAAGGRWETTWSIEVHDTRGRRGGLLAEIVSLQAQAKAVVHRTPQAKFSAVN